MNAHLPVDAWALDADDDAEVGGQPGHVVARPAVAAELVGTKVPKKKIKVAKKCI